MCGDGSILWTAITDRLTNVDMTVLRLNLLLRLWWQFCRSRRRLVAEGHELPSGWLGAGGEDG
jgi:hypothetical protein